MGNKASVEEMPMLPYNPNHLCYITKHPFRMQIAGKSNSGKTTYAIELVSNLMQSGKYEYLVIACPNARYQEIYRWLDVFDPEYIDNVEDYELDELKLQLEERKKNAEGLTLLLVDDMSHSNVLHGNRKGVMAEFSNNARHLECTVIVISQSITAISPAFRENCEYAVLFNMRSIGQIEAMEADYGVTKGQFKFALTGGTFREKVPGNFLFRDVDQERSFLNCTHLINVQ